MRHPRMSASKSTTMVNAYLPPPPPPNTPIPKSEPRQLTYTMPINIPPTERSSLNAPEGRSDELLSSRNPPSLMPDQGPSEPESPKHSSWNTLPDSTNDSWATIDDCAIEDDSDDDDGYHGQLVFQRSPPKLTPCQSLISMMLEKQKGKDKEKVIVAPQIKLSSAHPSTAPVAPPNSVAPEKKKMKKQSSQSQNTMKPKSGSDGHADAGYDDAGADDVLEMKRCAKGTSSSSSSRPQPIDIKPKTVDDVSHQTKRQEPEPRRRRHSRGGTRQQRQRQFIDPYKGKKRDLYNMSYTDYFMEHCPGFHDRGW